MQTVRPNPASDPEPCACNGDCNCDSHSHANNFDLAASLARKRRYDQALRALEQALRNNECSQAQALDLQARIYAQRGLHLHAEHCWLKALKLDPENPDYQRAVDYIRRARLPMPIFRGAIYSLAICCMLVVLLWAVVSAFKSAMERYDRQAHAMKQLKTQLDDMSQDASFRDGALVARLSQLEKNLAQGNEHGVGSLGGELAALRAEHTKATTQAAASQAAALAKTAAELAAANDKALALVRDQLAQQTKAVAEQTAANDKSIAQLREILSQQGKASVQTGADQSAAVAQLRDLLAQQGKTVASLQQSLASATSQLQQKLTEVGKSSATQDLAEQVKALESQTQTFSASLEEIRSAVKKLAETREPARSATRPAHVP